MKMTRAMPWRETDRYIYIYIYIYIERERERERDLADYMANHVSVDIQYFLLH